MNISDILKNIGIGAGPNDASAGGVPGAAGGVSALLAPQPADGALPAAGAPAGAAPALPAPSTPPATDAGLGGFLSRMVSKATARGDDGMSLLDSIGRLGSHLTDLNGFTRGAEAQDQSDATQRIAQTKRAQLMQMGKALNMSPREQLIFTADPDAWVKANATGLETANVGGGDSRINGATGQTTTAPKILEHNGEVASATPQSMRDLGGMNVSPQQTAEDDMKHAQEEAMTAYHQAMVRLGSERNRIAQQRANKAPAATATGLPPGYVPR